MECSNSWNKNTSRSLGEAVKEFRIAAIPGDGIGREVMPAAVSVLNEAIRFFDAKLHIEFYDFASAEYYLEHGKMMPDDWESILGASNAILFGAGMAGGRSGSHFPLGKPADDSPHIRPVRESASGSPSPRRQEPARRCAAG